MTMWLTILLISIIVGLGVTVGVLIKALIIQVRKNAIHEKWIIDLQCDRCKKNDQNVVPVPVTQHGKAVLYATGYDALLCRECRSSV